MIAADFAKVGVTARIVTPETFGEFLSQSSAKERDGAVLLGWTSDSGDPGEFLSVLLSCAAVGSSNRAQWCYAPFDELLRQANAASDPAVRAARLAEAQQILAVHQPITAIAHTVVSVPLAKSVRGFKAGPFGLHSFAGVDIFE
jgi:dipeptide transport system substrate-binding protein